MNKTIEMLLNHKSIRAWKDQAIEDDKLAAIFDVANRTSTSNGMQNSSVIRVKDPAKLQKIAEIATQPYLATAPELLIFIVDNYRNHKILEEKGQESNFTNDGDRFFQGWTDACLMAQNITVAAESLGLGVVYFGSVLNDIRELIKVLNLPKNTFPVVGLGIGYPNQEPQLKPRMDIDQKVFVDEYQVKDSYLEEMKEYDEVMQTYYDLRNANQRVDSFTNQVDQKNSAQIFHRSEIFDVIKEQGFNVTY